MAIQDFDDILPHVGSFGLFQKRILLLSLPVNYFLAVVYMSQIYQTLVRDIDEVTYAWVLIVCLITKVPEHWCAVPELNHLDPLVRRNLSIPLEERNGQLVYSRCRMFDVNYSQVNVFS